MKFTKHKLPNGLRYILAPMKNTEAVTVMILVGTGLMYEDKKDNGLAHFLEHMCFKGTSKRPSSAAISEEFDDLGARNNAFTGSYSTGYWGKGHKKDSLKILDLVADIYLDPVFPASEIEKEKGVIIQEINMYEDNPSSKASQVLDNLMYGDQAAGREIIGTKETVASFTREDLVRYRETHYTPQNTIVVVAGGFEAENGVAKIKSEIKKKFGKIAKKKRPALQKTIVKATKPKVRIHFKETDQTHFILSFYGYDMFDKRNPAISALSTVLGGSMSSRLFKKMREELGICYYIGTSVSAGMEDGTFSIYAGVANDRLEEAIEGVMSELRKIKAEIIEQDELQRSKNINLSGLVLGLESSSEVADRCAFKELYFDHIRTVEESTKKIQAVTAKQIHDVAGEVFETKKANLAVVGPHKDGSKLEKLLKF